MDRTNERTRYNPINGEKTSSRDVTILATGIKSERSVNCGIKRNQGLLDLCLRVHLK